MKIGYARVSTLDQSPALQTDALEQAGCERVYQEKASGAKAGRPELTAALKYLRTGDTLIVWKLDRLARSVKQLMDTVEDLRARGIEFQSLTEKIDTDSPGGKLIFTLFAGLAEFERSIIQERTCAGLASAKKQGRIGGRRPSMTNADVAAAKAMLADGSMPVTAIAARIGVSRATFYRYFPGERNAGEQSKPSSVGSASSDDN